MAFEEPAYAAHIQRVLAIPSKRGEKKLIHFLNRSEIEALLGAPDRTNWLGRRDHALLSLAIQAGLRLSELTSLDWESIAFGTGAHVRCVAYFTPCRPLVSPDVGHPFHVMSAGYFTHVGHPVGMSLA